MRILLLIMLSTVSFGANFKKGDCIIAVTSQLQGHRARILKIRENYYRLKPLTIKITFPWIEADIKGVDAIAEKYKCGEKKGRDEFR